ncbi:MAG: YigZ family protein [Paludibacteraceae bacterium]|nr:YigZ family protein [Paludibacteraceae bacterium]
MSSPTTYCTISALSEGLYKDKGSKFLAFAIPVPANSDTTLQDQLEFIETQLADYRRQYHDARHCCYAYMLGNEGETSRINDDGEPSGTAGRPILGQIRSAQITNVLVIVIRYFGGILLGTSGLIVAYKEATRDAINNAQIIERTVMQRITRTVSYLDIEQLQRKIKQTGSIVINTEYTDTGATFILDVPQLQVKLFE